MTGRSAARDNNGSSSNFTAAFDLCLVCDSAGRPVKVTRNLIGLSQCAGKGLSISKGCSIENAKVEMDVII